MSTKGVLHISRMVLLMALLISSPSITQAQGGSPWTTVGSAGVVDEESLGFVQLGKFSEEGVVQLKPEAPLNLPVTIRYNIVAVPGLLEGNCNSLTVRFRDNGKGALVRVSLRQYKIDSTSPPETGPPVFGFDSDIHAMPSSAFQVTTLRFDLPFNFLKNAYFFEVRLFKSDATGYPALGIIQLSRFFVLDQPCL